MADDPGSVAAPAEHNARSSFIRVFIRALGVTFFSVLSLAVAFYAFLFLPQVQDLFFDVRPSAWQDVLYWLEFYLLIILLWAVPLAFTARLLLLQNFRAIGVDSQSRFNWIVLGLPNLYLALTAVAVLLGLMGAVNNLPSPTVTPPGTCPSGGEPVWGICAETPLNGYLNRHLVILLAASLVAFVLLLVRNYFAQRYYRHFEKVEASRSGFYQKFLAGYESLSAKHQQQPSGGMYMLDLKPDWMNNSTWIAAQRAKVFIGIYLLVLMAIFVVAIIVHYLSYLEAVNGFFSFLSSGPLSGIFESLAVQRASYIPVALGAWLPFVSFLALLSNRFQAPIIVTIVLVMAALTLVTGDGHDPRLKVVSTKTASQSLKQAIGAWKEANGCGAAGTACPRPIIVSGEGGGSRAAYLMASTLGHLEDLSIANARTQPARRFSQQLFGISAVSGSSVGAALFLGALRVHDQTSAGTVRDGIYAQRLFFLNVVNPDRNFLGQCVTYKDALQAILSNDFITPDIAAYLARDLLSASRLPHVMDRAGVLESSWESAFSGVYGKGRENPMQAVLKTYQAGAAQGADKLLTAAPGAGSSCGPVQPQAGWVPVLFANATSAETGRRVIVSPIDWKYRVDPEKDAAEDTPKSAFADAYDFDRLVCSGQQRRSFFDTVAAYLPRMFSPVTKADCDLDSEKMTGIGLRLSTAAGISSRSPFISPHATVRDQNGHAIDRLVDGGYFDNSGAVTAYELAEAIKEIDPSLQPFVLQVTSEPDWFADSSNCERQSKRFAARRKPLGLPTVGEPQLPYQSSFKLSGVLGDALTVNNTRIARGFETITQMDRRMELLNGEGSYAQVYICPQRQKSGFGPLAALFGKAFTQKEPPIRTKRDITRRLMREKRAKEKAAQERIRSWKQVSLSWWLSPPLQAYLDGQVYAGHNAQAFEGVLTLLGQDSGTAAQQ